MIEELLQLLVCIVDAKLLKAVYLGRNKQSKGFY